MVFTQRNLFGLGESRQNVRLETIHDLCGWLNEREKVITMTHHDFLTLKETDKEAANKLKQNIMLIPSIVPDGGGGKDYGDITLLALDFDNEKKDPAMRDNILASVREHGLAHVWYESASSSVDVPRMRLFVPLSDSCETSRYSAVAKAFVATLGLGVDEQDSSMYSCKHGQYCPISFLDKSNRAQCIDGVPFDITGIEPEVAGKKGDDGSCIMVTDRGDTAKLIDGACKYIGGLASDVRAYVNATCFTNPTRLREFAPRLVVGDDGKLTDMERSGDGGILMDSMGVTIFNEKTANTLSGKHVDFFTAAVLLNDGDCVTDNVMRLVTRVYAPVREAINRLRAYDYQGYHDDIVAAAKRDYEVVVAFRGKSYGDASHMEFAKQLARKNPDTFIAMVADKAYADYLSSLTRVVAVKNCLPAIVMDT